MARYFSHFARSLTARNYDTALDASSWDVIITTNYDTNVDVALYELVYDPQYAPLTDIDLGADFYDPDEDDTPAFSEPLAAIALYKLHGSTNWLYCPRCSRIYVAAFGQSVAYLAKPKTHWERECYCGYSSLEPVLVAPSSVQDIVNPHLNYIWLRSYHALENADEWIFVGYSLPPEDLAVRSLLFRAADGMWERRGRQPKVTVVCPRDEGIKAQYTPFFKSRNIRVRYTNCGFQEHVQKRMGAERKDARVRASVHH